MVLQTRELARRLPEFLSRSSTYPITQALFLRVLGLVYLAAFASLQPQVRALFGSRGILPITSLLSDAKAQFGPAAYSMLPTIFWWGSADRWLEGVCLVGSAASVLLLTGFFSRIAAAICWLLYLSLVSVGAPFTNFQWDALLLESGFLALFAGAPWLVWGYRFLLLRLMFESGFVKLTSGDANWTNLHALRFHFFTQPLPTPLAWHAHRSSPAWLDAFTAATLAIELAVPFFLFGPKRVREAATVLLMILQLAILLTGNYGFFNLLTLAICLWGFDDRRFAPLERALRIRSWNMPRLRIAGNVGVAVIIFLGAAQLARMIWPSVTPAGVRPVERLLAPFEVVNSYGLFAVMTTTRSEIVLQGSTDGVHWADYEFRYKPGDTHRSLPLLGPYMPRLDWQMWFAALGTFDENRWVGALMYRLLVGDPGVTRLLAATPFVKPPPYMRAKIYDYTFSSREERERTGAIWHRELRGDWYGPVSLTGR